MRKGGKGFFLLKDFKKTTCTILVQEQPKTVELSKLKIQNSVNYKNGLLFYKIKEISKLLWKKNLLVLYTGLEIRGCHFCPINGTNGKMF